LLVFGSLSDYLGRRRVIAVALAAGAGACGLFLAAHGVGLLFAARALQGAAAAVAVLAIPETAPRRSGALASLRPRAAVPRQARGMFAVALPVMIAAPALNGFYLSLGPSLAAQVLRSPDLLWGGW
jgi:MFS family permease